MIYGRPGWKRKYLTAFLQHELSSATVSLLRLNDSEQYVKNGRQYDWINSINTISDTLLPLFEYIPFRALKNLHLSAWTSWVNLFSDFSVMPRYLIVSTYSRATLSIISGAHNTLYREPTRNCNMIHSAINEEKRR